MVSRAEAVLMVEPRHLDQLLHPMFEGARPAGRRFCWVLGQAGRPGWGQACGRGPRRCMHRPPVRPPAVPRRAPT